MPDAAAAAARVTERIQALSRGNAAPLVGLNGAQGAGKSTLAHLIATDLARRGQRCALLSLDDFYLTRAERARLAHEIHPLCGTRGVPGTHDVALLETTLAALMTSGEVAVPRFDKLADERVPRRDWAIFQAPADVILLEGWCIGLLSADLPAWAGPINALEIECDANGAWFDWSRAALERVYEPLWPQLDLLVSIELSEWNEVIESRLRQETEAAAASGRAGMDRARVTRFAEHYERYTRALWAAMPGQADMLLRRNENFGYTVEPGLQR